MDISERVLQKDKVIVFEISDSLDHPFFWWPRTLVNYPVRFECKVRPEQLMLTDRHTGKSHPFQLSDIEMDGPHMNFARVHFFTDLPSGAMKAFEFSMSDDSRGRISPPSGMKVLNEDGFIVVDAGTLKVRIPVSQSVMRYDSPAPVFQVSRGNQWQGENKLLSKNRKILNIHSACVDSGPLFVTYLVQYRFEGGGNYEVTVRVIEGYDFFEFDETMNGLNIEDEIHLIMPWKSFSPTHWHATTWPDHHWSPSEGKYGEYDWRRIDKPFMIPYNGEDPAFSGPGSAGNEQGELQIRLAPYIPFFAYHTRPAASFWDDRTGESMGVFIHRHHQWQDEKYAIWASGDTLQVRYFYAEDILSWKWPLVQGTRSTCIAVYHRQKDDELYEILMNNAMKAINSGTAEEEAVKLTRFPTAYTSFLHNRYVTLSLDRVKDWVLYYKGKVMGNVFRSGKAISLEEFERRIWSGGRVAVATKGIEVFHERPYTFEAVEMRMIYEWVVEGFCRFYPQMSKVQQERLTALLLITAYVCSHEEVAPLVTSLGGHPNFLADLKSAPALIAFVFPEHPMAREWADQFEKFIELNTRFHTRPSVLQWEAKGGRWTENLGIYVWAFLRPVILAEYALQEYVDGKNRLANDHVAALGEWLVQALTAPIEEDKPDRGSGEPRRVYPPQGAHADRRVPFRTMSRLAECMMRFNPLLAEHLLWATRPTDPPMEKVGNPDSWDIIFDRVNGNKGTKPKLQSSKFTGYGVILRANVDTPQEISVHLQQIDSGPNYRWGIAGEGGCGVIYYYAQGKSYSHNGPEDVGDRRVQDTDLCSSFGVWKDGRYKSIGMNELKKPMYDLDWAQFTVLTAREGVNAYSWPEYRSRSAMLIGGDYLVVYDEVGHPTVRTRFSWFTRKDEPFPFIHFVTGMNGPVAAERNINTELITATTRGRWYDGQGDCMAVITHKPDVHAVSTDYGCKVTSTDSVDYIFRNAEEIMWEEEEISFAGTAGMIRRRQNGHTDCALFQGRSISTRELTLHLNGEDSGVSASYRNPEDSSGFFFSRRGCVLEMELKEIKKSPLASFYVDGIRQDCEWNGNRIMLRLPPGKHHWQLTAQLPVPQTPEITRTENRCGGATVWFTPSASAERYLIELSRDGGDTWQAAATAEKPPCSLDGLINGEKVHVRIAACNGEIRSDYSAHYPVYVTDLPPSHPDGLRLKIIIGGVHLTWGEVLGVQEYVLYRRIQGEANTAFSEIYRGLNREFVDRAALVRMPFQDPYPEGSHNHVDATIYEYTVCAVNENGQGANAIPIDTHPASWMNWDPLGQDGRFKRRHTFMEQPFSSAQDMEDYYP